MKFTVTMKDPDTLWDSVNDAAKMYAAGQEGLDEDEREAVAERRAEKLRDFASEWFTYGEYVSVEFDTDAGTATVLKAKDR